MLRRRALAALLDYLVILAWMAVLALGAGALVLLTSWDPGAWSRRDPVRLQAMSFLLLTVPVGGYLWCTESGPANATWGKRRMRLRVITRDGSAAGRVRIAVRTVVKLAPWECAHALVWRLVPGGGSADPSAWLLIGLTTVCVVAIGYVVLVAVLGRGPHDLAAGTVVAPTRQGSWGHSPCIVDTMAGPETVEDDAQVAPPLVP